MRQLNAPSSSTRSPVVRPSVVLWSVLTLACTAVAGSAAAQVAPTNGAGLRYLTWPGKPAVAARPAPRPIAVAPTSAAPTAVALGGGAARDAALPPLSRLDASVGVSAGATPSHRRGLTPATAWTAPVHAASPTPAPSPTTHAEPAPTPVPEAAPAPAPEAAPQAAPQAAVVDPMAPRRDAAIFRLQRPQGAEATPEAGAQVANAQIAGTQTALAGQPQSQGARFYSVHRQAGRHPDAISAPQPTYLDALPVEMSQPPASTDLAQPDGPPALVRDASGKVRPLPQSEPDALP